jgi:hypothetical protein
MRSPVASVLHRLVGPSVLSAVIVAFVRCSATGDSTSSIGPTGGGDAGTNESDTGFKLPGDSGTAPSLPRVLAVVHAADIFDFRVCFATSSTADGATFDVIDGNPLPDDPLRPMPQANYPGIGRGNGAIVAPEIASGSAFVIPFLVDAFVLTKHAGDDCKKILGCSGVACVQSPTERVKLPGIPSADLLGGGTRLLAVRGSGATLAMTVIRVDGMPAPAPAIGGQLAHLAPTLPRLAATYGAADGGGASLGSAAFGAAGPSNLGLTRPDDVKGMDLYGSMGVALSLAGSPDGGTDAGSSAPFFFSSLAAIQQASDPSLPPNELFKPGASYVFVVTGDPTVPKTIDGGANPDYPSHGLHVIAIRSSAPVGDGGAF